MVIAPNTLLAKELNKAVGDANKNRGGSILTTCVRKMVTNPEP
jgi:hypothetical protein